MRKHLPDMLSPVMKNGDKLASSTPVFKLFPTRGIQEKEIVDRLGPFTEKSSETGLLPKNLLGSKEASKLTSQVLAAIKLLKKAPVSGGAPSTVPKKIGLFSDFMKEIAISCR